MAAIQVSGRKHPPGDVEATFSLDCLLSALTHSLQRPLLKPWTRSGSHFALFSSDTPRKNGAKSKACTFTFDVSVLPAQITFRILGLTVTQLYMLK